MKVGGTTVLVTGANRGLGRALVDALRHAGAAKIYAAARNAAAIEPGKAIETAKLDITNGEQVAAAAARCRHVNILINNAGVARFNPALVVSWFNVPMQGSYCASKAAEWSLTRAARFELRAQGTLVVGVFAGYIDTDMTRALALAKTSPDVIAARVLAGIEADREEILADERAETLRRELFKDDGPFDANMQKTWDDHVRRQAPAPA